MFHRVYEALMFVALMMLAPLAVTTLSFFLDVEFPYTMLAGVSISLSVAFYFITKAENGHWQMLYFFGALAMIATTIGLMLASAGAGFGFLVSGEAWIVGASAWLVLSMWMSFGTLMGKSRPRPVSS